MRVLLIMLILLILAVPGVQAANSPSPPGPHLVTVMTYNVYHGVDAEFAAVAASASFPDLLARVADVYLGYQARDFPGRAAAIAAQVAQEQPALIALQEVILVRTGPLLDPAPAQTVAFDYLQILLDALAARGLHYTVVAQIEGFDAELPGGLGFDVRHTDRDVILARSDLPPGHLRLSNVQTHHFATNCQIPTTLAGPLTVLRGWISVDVETRGRTFRFIDTHLYGECPPTGFAVQVAQAQELLDAVAGVDLPIILAGDMNVSPLDPAPSAYHTFANAAFADAWLQGGAGPGFTCCQAPDLLNANSLLDTRIDMLLARGNPQVTSISLTGDDPAQRTSSGLWPSDHAAVVATFRIPK